MNRTNLLAYQAAFRAFSCIDGWTAPHAVTLTIRQGMAVGGDTYASFLSLTKDAASQNYRHFLNVLNGRVFGKAAKRGKACVRSMSVIEGGNGTRLHIHGLIDCPSNGLFEIFPDLIAESWRRTQWGHHEINVQAGADNGFVDYISKFRDKPSFVDAIDWVNYHKNERRV